MSGSRFDSGWALLLTSFSISIIVPFNKYSEKEYALTTQGFIFSSKSLGLLLLLILRNHSEIAILRVGLVCSTLSSLIQSFLLEEQLNHELFLIVACRGLEGGGRALLFFAFLLRIYPKHRAKSVVIALSLSVLAQLIGLGVCMIFFSERVSGYLFLAHGIILLFTFGVARCSNTPEEEQRSAELSSSTVPLKQIFKRSISALMSLVSCQLGLHFYDPLLLTQLRIYFAFNNVTVALFYLVTIVSMVLSAGLLLSLPIEVNRSRIMVLAPLISGVGVILSGPSKLFRLPITPYIVFTGLFLLGVSCGILATAVLSDIVQKVRILYPRYMARQVIRLCIFVFVCFYFAGEGIAHLLAGSLLQIVGVSSASDIIGLVSLAVGLIVLILQKLEEKQRQSISILQQQDQLSAMLGEEVPEQRYSESDFRPSRN